MASRRTFLWSSAAAMVLSRVPRVFARGADQRGGRAAGQDPATLPPSIAALTSMADQVRPITNDERKARLERARRIMAERRIDALLLAGGTSMQYFLNMRWGGGERLFACVIPVKGEPFFVCPGFEHDRALEQIALGPLGGGRADIRLWQEDESPYSRVAQGLRDRGIASGSLGVEEATKFVWSDSIAQAAPQLRVVS